MTSDLLQSTFDNGVRIVSSTRPGDRFALGLWLYHGSRHESPAQAGYTHLLEHLWFAGAATRHRNARLGFSVADSVNARTGRELTALYGCVPQDQWQALTALLCTTLVTPCFGDQDLVRERAAIARERASHAAGRTEDLACAALWPAHPLGRPVAGPPGALATATAADLRHYHSTLLQGARLCVVAVGPAPHSAVVDACRGLETLPQGTAAEAEPPRLPSTPGTSSDRLENPLWALPMPGWTARDFHCLLLVERCCAAVAQQSASVRRPPWLTGTRLTLFSDVGLLLIEAAAPVRQRADCHATLDRAFATLAASGLHKAILQRVADTLYAEVTDDSEPLRLVHRLGRELSYRSQVAQLQSHRAALDAVTPEAVGDVLRHAWQARRAWR